jgi:hypothetical protein
MEAAEKYSTGTGNILTGTGTLSGIPFNTGKCYCCHPFNRQYRTQYTATDRPPPTSSHNPSPIVPPTDKDPHHHTYFITRSISLSTRVALLPSTMATRAVTVPFPEALVLELSVRLIGRTARTAEPLEVRPAAVVSGTVATETELSLVVSGGPVSGVQQWRMHKIHGVQFIHELGSIRGKEGSRLCKAARWESDGSAEHESAATCEESA